MGTGADVALEAADIALMHSDPWGVVDAIRLSEVHHAKDSSETSSGPSSTMHSVSHWPRSDLSPIIAGAAMALSSVSVVSNSLLLRRLETRKGSAC